ncbi:MAG: VWA domain-containing protein, partial [Candidatus Pacearchaeota archaeon]|nr:VWA domain-containing protein [Candidatus Pacearchaeota archaeon]
MKKNKKAYFFTLDALFALTILLAIIILIPFSHIRTTPEKYKISFLQEDMLTILSNIKIKEINNSLIEENLARLDFTTKEFLEERDSLLDTITKIWASNATNSLNITRNITSIFFSEVFSPKDNVGLFFVRGGALEAVFLKNDTGLESSKGAVVAHKFVTGAEFGVIGGYTGRAYRYKKWREKFIYFGGYVGDGEIIQRFKLPKESNVSSFVIEAAIMIHNSTNPFDDFNITINDNYIGTYRRAESELKPLRIELSEEQIEKANFSENNYIKFSSNVRNKNLYIAGGFIKIKYKTPTISYFGPEEIILPEIRGAMNIYDSLYIPGKITSMTLHLSYEQQANTTPFIRLGNATLWRDERTNKTGAYTIFLTNENISSKLAEAGLTYDDISKKTVPLRIGLEEIWANISGGNADVILITDVSGSMRWTLVNSSDGIIRNCTDPQLFENTTQRLSLAKCLNKEFIDAILNSTGNRIGLISFRTAVENTHQLSVNRETLHEQINAYTASGGTCICCAINEAYTLFDKPEIIIPRGRNEIYWKTTITYSCGDSCGFNVSLPSQCNISNWTRLNFNDSAWNNQVLPISSLGQENAVIYFRKKFYLPTSVKEDGLFQVNHQRGIECYLNDNLIGRDDSCVTSSSSTNPNLWPSQWNVSASYFRIGENILACRIRSGSGSNRRGLYFDAQLTATTVSGERKRFVVVMSDGIAGLTCVNQTGIPNETCASVPTRRVYNGTSTSGFACCSGDQTHENCNGTACHAAMNNTVWSANRTYHEKIKAGGG